jgi:hypothetical protein
LISKSTWAFRNTMSGLKWFCHNCSIWKIYHFFLVLNGLSTNCSSMSDWSDNCKLNWWYSQVHLTVCASPNYPTTTSTQETCTGIWLSCTNFTKHDDSWMKSHIKTSTCIQVQCLAIENTLWNWNMSSESWGNICIVELQNVDINQ